MFRVINTVHRIRPRSTGRFSPVVNVGGSRIGPKKSRNFSKEFVCHHYGEFETKLRTGEIKVVSIGNRQVVSADELAALVLATTETHTAVKVEPEKAKPKSTPKAKAKPAKPAKASKKKAAPKKPAAKKAAPKKKAKKKAEKSK